MATFINIHRARQVTRTSFIMSFITSYITPASLIISYMHHTCSVVDVYLIFQGSIESYLLSKRNARIKEKLEERQMLAARGTGLILRCVVL
jgi:hypothetical protein